MTAGSTADAPVPTPRIGCRPVREAELVAVSLAVRLARRSGGPHLAHRAAREAFTELYRTR
ncbi:hypothetical protein OIB37_02690 [Streptomyces sp. NBC_00820]|uniref:hypothetical protein n=1 Tax=Streptomyces sp. NBC_00820 TaxID=2975842 RepID=UPI002ED1C500|nr:hypothetical protein OIB37_02690 [Streptomyces sp. NBC_00820]